MPTASISAAHMPAAQPLAKPGSGRGQRRNRGQRQHQLHIVVVDIAWREDADEMQCRRADDDDRQHRPIAADGALPILIRKNIASAKSASGQAIRATVSPIAMLPVTAATASMIAAIGASTSRDQCMTKPPSGPMRY